MNDAKVGIQHIFQTSNSLTFALCASGHAAMECTIINSCEKSDKILIASNGIWGERAAEMAKRAGINAVKLEGQPGRSFSRSQVEEKLKSEKPKAFFITHGESSTGVLQNLEEIGEACQR